MSLYPIRTLAELTGVATTTLRAWERRYGLLKPERTPKGHRLYSEQDVDLIRNIVRLLNQNHSISEAVRIVRHGEDISSAVPGTSQVEWTHYQALLLQHIESFNDEGLDSVYNQALAMYPVDLVTQNVILPVLKTLGVRWSQRGAGIAEEHFFSAYLRNKLGARLHHETRRARGQTLLAACIPGEQHELGLLLFCLAAISHGYRIVYLGTNTPLDQIQPVVQKANISAVVLSATTIKFPHDLKQQLSNLNACLDTPLLIGGAFSSSNRQLLEAMGIESLGELHPNALEKLESIVPAHKRP